MGERDSDSTELAEARKLVSELQQEILTLRHQILTQRDHAIGAEAEIAVARRARDKALAKASKASDELAALRASVSWRLGSALVRPFGRLGKLRRRRKNARTAVARNATAKQVARKGAPAGKSS
jgi:hypothetical protein